MAHASLAKGLRLLELLAEAEMPLGVSEVARRLGLPKSNVHSLLQTLMESGYVERADQALYRLNLRLWEFGSIAISHDRIRKASHPHLHQLAQRTGGTVFLAMLAGSDVLYVDRTEVIAPAHAAPRRIRAPAIFPASGKILLALHPNRNALIAAAIAALPPGKQPPDLSALVLELDAAAADRFAASTGGWTDETRFYAAAIADRSGHALASIGVGVPIDAAGPEIAHMVVRTADSIGAALGHDPVDYH